MDLPKDPERIPTVAGHSGYTALSLRTLSDDALLARLDVLVAQERESTADVIEHLMEVDRRELVIDRAYPTLFWYCVRKLGYSEAAAYARVRAARAAADYPDILERLRAGRLHLESIVRLSPYLDRECREDLLERASGASKREVLALVAQLQTEPGPQRDAIIPVKAPAIAETSMPSIDSSASVHEPAAEIIPPPQHRFHFTADAELVVLVERLRGLLRHKFPDGRLEGIFKEAAKELLQRIEREKGPAAKKPRSIRTPRPLQAAGSRIVPRSVKKQVWARDGGQCAYVASDGRRCESRDALEYDHIIPWADGGRSDTPENIRLLCRAHNQRLGRRRFGPRRKT